MQCHVVAGFPERASPRALAELGTPGQHDARVAREEVTGLTYLPRIERQAFNAAMLVAPDGSLVKVFRKHFLYETDTTWADEGGGFEYLDIPGLGRLCVAICMDLNRTHFHSPQPIPSSPSLAATSSLAIASSTALTTSWCR